MDNVETNREGLGEDMAISYQPKARQTGRAKTKSQVDACNSLLARSL